MGYTSIEQSKKLVEAGLNPNTADMSWEMTAEGLGEPFGWQPYLGKNPVIEMNSFSFRNGYVLPCWSLGALIELMPSIIRLETHGYVIEIGKLADEEHWYVSYEWEGHIYQIFKGSLLDATIEMITWLLENNYIKKETK